MTLSAADRRPGTGKRRCHDSDSQIFGASREGVRVHLEKRNIESRPIRTLMHLQPVFRKYRVVGGNVSKKIFGKGLYLSSGSTLTDEELCLIAETILSTPRRRSSKIT